MVAGQRLVAPDGYEVCLFPLPYMYISQGENGNISHHGTYNIDFIGWVVMAEYMMHLYMHLYHVSVSEL